jgi:hypothetical protein
MKRYLSTLLPLAILMLSANQVSAQSTAAAGFEKLKPLVGEWEGTGPHGSTNISYQLVSGGSAIMETLVPTGEPSMVTMYHLNSDKLMMTHYCSIGNQPRMQAEVLDSEIKKINFTFVDVTNLANRAAGHMIGLTLTFDDKDHLMQVWTWREAGKDKTTTFSFTRKQ